MIAVDLFVEIDVSAADLVIGHFAPWYLRPRVELT